WRQPRPPQRYLEPAARRPGRRGLPDCVGRRAGRDPGTATRTRYRPDPTPLRRRDPATRPDNLGVSSNCAASRVGLSASRSTTIRSVASQHSLPSGTGCGRSILARFSRPHEDSLYRIDPFRGESVPLRTRWVRVVTDQSAPRVEVAATRFAATSKSVSTSLSNNKPPVPAYTIAAAKAGGVGCPVQAQGGFY